MNRRVENEVELPWIMEIYRLVILGDSTVGKSSLVNYHIHGKNLDFMKATFVATFSSIFPKKSFKFDSWEVAGRECWQRLAQFYYKDSQAALVVYDVQDYHTLQSAKMWIKELRRNMSNELVIALIGNKVDLWQQDCINSAEVQNYALKNGLIFMETSAKTGVNVREIFLAIAEELEKQKSRQSENKTNKPQVCVIL